MRMFSPHKVGKTCVHAYVDLTMFTNHSENADWWHKLFRLSLWLCVWVCCCLLANPFHRTTTTEDKKWKHNEEKCLAWDGVRLFPAQNSNFLNELAREAAEERQRESFFQGRRRRRRPVWPDFGIKSSQYSPKTCPNSNRSSFYIKCDSFQKVSKYLGYFWIKICHQELWKIAQSGHTVDDDVA